MPVSAGDRHGDGAAARLPVRELGDRIRRLQDGPGPQHASPGAVDRQDRDGHLRRPRRGDERARRGGAASDPQAAGRARGGRGLPDQGGVRARVLHVQGDVRGGRRQAIPGTAAELVVHHGLPHAADDEGRMADPHDAQPARGRRDPDRVLEGRVRPRSAGDQLHVPRRPRDGRQPRDLQTRRQGDRGAERRGRHVHGEVHDERGGLVLPHALERLERGRHRLVDVGRRRPSPHERDVPVVPGRVDVDDTRDGVDVCAVREFVQAVPAGLVGTDGHHLEPRQSDVRVPRRRRAQGQSRRVAPARSRHEPLPRHRGDDRRRAPRDQEQDRGAGDVRGERVRSQGRPEGADVAARGDRRVRAERGRSRSLRRLRVRAPGEHRPAGAGDLRQPDGHGLGAAAVLRARLRARTRPVHSPA